MTAPALAIAPRPSLDERLARLQEKRTEFARLGLGEKIALLRTLLTRTIETAEDAVRAACTAKGIDYDSPESSEEWFGGPVTQARVTRLLIQSLRDIDRYGRPLTEWSRATNGLDGRLTLPVFPASGFDRVLFSGFTAEVRFAEGIDQETAEARQAAFYRGPDNGGPDSDGPEGGVSLVLGAGNVASIGPLDVLHKMFVEGKVVALKLNPVNDYLGPFVEEQFAAFIRRGYLDVFYGGADVGARLTRHEAIDDIHITGSDKTHDAIVWGPPGPEQEERKRRGEPALDKPITSELGNVTPVIVTPAAYSPKQLRAMVDNTVAMVVTNASFNCNAAKLLVTSRAWPQRERFLEMLSETLATFPRRRAYYPGAEERWHRLVDGRDNVQKLGPAPTEGTLPWTLVLDVDAEDTTDAVFHTEPFCSVLSEVALEGDTLESFLERAVPFVNDQVWGTLSATIVVHPDDEKDPVKARFIDRAVADMRYGCVAINHWSALAYAFGTTPWGAAPGATLDDIQSGIGWVHNTYLLEDVQKCVLRGPLVGFPKPPWTPGHRTAHLLAQRMLRFEGEPSWWRLPGMIFTALRG